MPLLIDGYNLLHATMPPSLAGLDEEGLCRLLARSPWRGQSIRVVCDGVPKPDTPSASPVPEVDLIYSGRKRSADDLIIQFIDADTAPRRLLVVSDDHQIQKAARRRRASPVPCAAFVHQLSTLSATKPSLELEADRPTDLDAGEVRQWLKEFGLDDRKG
ncbi:MAG: NYN domain-containing protein [Phycisphaeraceae bacterium]|nr:NYN domain-containing protein [Phycisphaeraceae bacterium]